MMPAQYPDKYPGQSNMQGIKYTLPADMRHYQLDDSNPGQIEPA